MVANKRYPVLRGEHAAARAYRPLPKPRPGSSREKQCLDLRLDEVLVGGQRFGYSSFPNQHKGNAIGETPLLVLSFLEEPIGGFKQRPVESHDFDVRVAAQPIDKRGGGASVRNARQRGAGFKNHCVGRDDFVIAALEIEAEVLRNCVVLIARRKQRDSVSGIEKNGGAHYT